MNRIEIQEAFLRFHNFNDAYFEDVIIGPRHELRLHIVQLIWNGNTGRYRESIYMRLGKIEQFDELLPKFIWMKEMKKEIGFFGPDPRSNPFKGSRCRITFVAEREENRFSFWVGNISIDESSAQQVAAGNDR